MQNRLKSWELKELNKRWYGNYVCCLEMVNSIHFLPQNYFGFEFGQFG